MRKWVVGSLLVAAVITAAVVGTATRASAAPRLTKITVQLKWVPQAQFAGYYAAADLGYPSPLAHDAEIAVIVLFTTKKL